MRDVYDWKIEQYHLTYIVDGYLYERVARLAMEYTHRDLMQKFGLVWEVVCTQRDIRALPNWSHCIYRF